MGKSTLKPLSLNLKYKTHLNSNNQETWDLLFDITKAKPDHLKIKGSAVINLIEALEERLQYLQKDIVSRLVVAN